jgi:hypothetical protein
MADVVAAAPEEEADPVGDEGTDGDARLPEQQQSAGGRAGRAPQGVLAEPSGDGAAQPSTDAAEEPGAEKEGDEEVCTPDSPGLGECANCHFHCTWPKKSGVC